MYSDIDASYLRDLMDKEEKRKEAALREIHGTDSIKKIEENTEKLNKGLVSLANALDIERRERKVEATEIRLKAEAQYLERKAEAAEIRAETKAQYEERKASEEKIQAKTETQYKKSNRIAVVGVIIAALALFVAVFAVLNSLFNFVEIDSTVRPQSEYYSHDGQHEGDD